MPLASPRYLHYEDNQAVIHKVVVGPYDNNVYVLRCKQTGEAVLLDAANEHELLLDLCRELGVREVLETHGHLDHIQAVPAVRDAGYEVGVTAGDAGMLPSYDFVLEDETVITSAGCGCTRSPLPVTRRARCASALEGSPDPVLRRHAVPRRPRQHHLQGANFPRSSARSRIACSPRWAGRRS